MNLRGLMNVETCMETLTSQISVLAETDFKFPLLSETILLVFSVLNVNLTKLYHQQLISCIYTTMTSHLCVPQFYTIARNLIWPMKYEP